MAQPIAGCGESKRETNVSTRNAHIGTKKEGKFGRRGRQTIQITSAAARNISPTAIEKSNDAAPIKVIAKTDDSHLLNTAADSIRFVERILNNSRSVIVEFKRVNLPDFGIVHHYIYPLYSRFFFTTLFANGIGRRIASLRDTWADAIRIVN